MRGRPSEAGKVELGPYIGERTTVARVTKRGSHMKSVKNEELTPHFHVRILGPKSAIQGLETPVYGVLFKKYQ